MKVVKGDLKDLNLAEVGILHAGPSSGKTWAAKGLIEMFPDRYIIDLDPFQRIIMTKEIKDAFVKQGLHTSAPPKRYPWMVQERGSQLLALAVATNVECMIVTNQTITNTIDDLAEHGFEVREQLGQMITFFRTPADLKRVADERAQRYKSQSSAPLSVFQSWYKGWEKSVNSYDIAVELEEGDYLADIIGVSVLAKDVDAEALMAQEAAKAYGSLLGVKCKRKNCSYEPELDKKS